MRPLKNIKNAATPTPLLHGENDHDVPIAPEEMFIGLRKQGVQAMLVRYPGEGHGLHRPEHREDSTRRRTLEWFARYVQPEKVVTR